MGTLASHSLRLLLVGGLIFLPRPLSRPQERVEELRSRFDAETNPVSKAKFFKKLGPAEFKEMHAQIGAGHDDQALKILEQYRDQVRATFDGLRALHVDPEKKPAGFKPLQIELREGLRRLDQLILELPVGDRDAFRAVRADLAAMQNQMLDLLFPRQPGRASPKGNKKG